MRYYNASTKKGQDLIKRASNYEGTYLWQVYGHYSHEKAVAYETCYDMFLQTENHNAFSICSHNTFGFSCSWVGTLNGENILRYETKDTSYTVFLDR